MKKQKQKVVDPFIAGLDRKERIEWFLAQHWKGVILAFFFVVAVFTGNALMQTCFTVFFLVVAAAVIGKLISKFDEAIKAGFIAKVKYKAALSMLSKNEVNQEESE